jgi:hypothetical protein
MGRGRVRTQTTAPTPLWTRNWKRSRRLAGAGAWLSWLLEWTKKQVKCSNKKAFGTVRLQRRWSVNPERLWRAEWVCSDEAEEAEEEDLDDEEEEEEQEVEEERRTKSRGRATAQSSDSEEEDGAGGVQSAFMRHLEHELSAAQVR